MECTYLMLNDWVLDTYTGKPMRVQVVKNTVGKGLEPIPITEDFLKKNGFEFSGDNIWQFQERPFYVWYNTKEHELGVEIEVNNYMEEVGAKLCLDIYFNSVHELQHALKMFEIEKDIRL